MPRFLTPEEEANAILVAKVTTVVENTPIQRAFNVIFDYIDDPELSELICNAPDHLVIKLATAINDFYEWDDACREAEEAAK